MDNPLTAIIATTLPLLIGWAADKILGDPPQLPHLVVAFGKTIAWGEHRLNKGANRTHKGTAWAVALILLTCAATAILLHAAAQLSILLHITLSAILIFYSLAGTTLIREVRQTFREVDRSIDQGRQQLARIVGRDTARLTAREVRTAALETLAENLSDGVIAPLFWYLIGGIPAMLTYKMINTLDSMIGYKNERYLQFGRTAARIDDIANYIPARLTAALMLLVSRQWRLITFLRKYARQHTSPNAGWPEAALAGILNCRFGGPHNYFGKPLYKPYIGHNERKLTISDMQKAIQINRRAELTMITILAAIQILVACL
ncbi:MAG: adenosylcobinamide-phosphate synthase CbiB [Mediterranea sp.]|jgi:adenosylcobinamide-phosphate synthase|nr:adenosylcobinamide-phosphate synthase CbiB [Mediterranea sp.]